MQNNLKPIPIPLSFGQILEMSFLENRARLLEIAAFLDRMERSADAETGKNDFRYQALVTGIRLLLDTTEAGRTKAIQLSFSDPTTEPLASAAGLKAHGAWYRGKP
jgi:hypothetical protein